jgi:hypothetical protein
MTTNSLGVEYQPRLAKHTRAFVAFAYLTYELDRSQQAEVIRFTSGSTHFSELIDPGRGHGVSGRCLHVLEPDHGWQRESARG